MAYKDKYGITKLREGRVDNLSINWDYEDNPDDLTQRFPVFLFTPDMEDTKNHYHIELNYEQAEKLKDWLEDYLVDAYKCSDYEPSVEEMKEIYPIMDKYHINKRNGMFCQLVFTEREIGMVYKFMECESLEHTADEFFVPRERVRQVLEKVKRKYNKIKKETEND